MQVTKTTIKAWMSLNFCWIPSPTTELAALERLEKIPIDLYWENYCDDSSTFIFDLIVFFLAGDEDNLEFRLDPRIAELSALEHLEVSP